MLELAENDIHLWFAEAEDFPLPELQDGCLQWLSAQEQARFHRYRQEKSRHEFLLGQMLARATLSQYQQKSVSEWQFVLQENGKPMLADGEVAGPLSFNLSHSDGRVAFAIGRHQLLGIDIEGVTAIRREEKIARRHFSAAELGQLDALHGEEKRARFYQLWTLKESYIKATGQGLKTSLSSFGFDIRGERLQFRLHPDREFEAEKWQFWQFNIDSRYWVALGCKPECGNKISTLRSFNRTDIEIFSEFDPGIVHSCH